MQEFITLLKSLHEPREEAERKAARREARKRLSRLMEAYESLAWKFSRKSEKVKSAENLVVVQFRFNNWPLGLTPTRWLA